MCEPLNGLRHKETAWSLELIISYASKLFIILNNWGKLETKEISDPIHKILDNKKQRKLKPLPAEFHFEQSVELQLFTTFHL